MNRLTTKYLKPRHARINGVAGPFGDADAANVLPQQALPPQYLNQVAAQTGKPANKVTWDDVYKLTGVIANLWAIIAPYVLARRTPPPPANWQPPNQAKQSGIGTIGVVLMLALALGMVAKKNNRKTR